ncbi:MAG: DegV family protein [Firmicutes bacterium]|nr:DegV family protein [Bacillota bacterium]
MGIRILTDSACDLPKEIVEKYDIDVIPLMVYLENQEYLDNVNIKPKQLYDEMREGKIPKTAQVPPTKFEGIFKKLAKENQSCIYIAFSSELSGTYQTSELIKGQIKEEYPNFDLDIINTKCASLGFGLVVYKAAKMAKEGKSKDEIIKAINFYSEHMEHIFTVDDLEYLYRGGRVSRGAAFVGSVLKIKPILDVEDGKLIPIEKVRGRKKVFKRMLEIMDERGINLENQTIGINHGDDLKAAKKLKKEIIKRYNPKEIVIGQIGCAVGAHSGPGTLSIYFLNEKY